MIRYFVPALALLLALPLTSFAHKAWLLPSQTVLSGVDPWVTVDGAISNDLFYFNHHPLRLDNLVITAPDGSQVEAENPAVGKYRSVFDLPLTQDGTYRIAVVNDGLFASWEENGQRRRWRGTAEAFAAEVPSTAQNLQVSQSIGRIETFVTNNAPTDISVKSSGRGIELLPLTHPNDLYAEEEGRFRLLVDGKPTPGVEVEVVRGGTRYRNSQEEVRLTTDSNGEFSVTWSKPGMYFIETSLQDDKTEVPQATSRRLSYSVTLEVLPQ